MINSTKHQNLAIKHSTHNTKKRKRVEKTLTNDNIYKFLDELQVITCPISMQVYRNPIIIDSGITLEKSVFNRITTDIDWDGKCPITKQEITKRIVPNRSVANIIDKLLDLKPDLSKNRYLPTHIGNKKLIKKIIADGMFDKLLGFIDYDFIRLVTETHKTSDGNKVCLLSILLKTCTNTAIIKYVFNNSLNKNDLFTWQVFVAIDEHAEKDIKLFEYLMYDMEMLKNLNSHKCKLLLQYAPCNIVKVVLDKIEECNILIDEKGENVLHYLLYNYNITVPFLKHVISKGFSTSVLNDNNMCPLASILYAMKEDDELSIKVSVLDFLIGVTKEDKLFLVNNTQFTQYPILCFMCKNNNLTNYVTIVEKLIHRYPTYLLHLPIKAHTSIYSMPPLYNIAKKCDINFIKKIITKYITESDIQQHSYISAKIAHIICKRFPLKSTLEFLISVGFEIDCKHSVNKTLLHNICRKCDYNTLCELFKTYGTEMEIEDCDKNTPTTIAISRKEIYTPLLHK